MATFVTNCPACKKAIQVSTGPFAKKKVKCSCGYVIDVNTERMETKICPHCGNNVTYDKSKKNSAECPVCHTKLFDAKKVKLSCPGCSFEMECDASAEKYTCPNCKIVIDVQARLAQEKSSGKTSIIKWDMGLNDIFVYRHPIENFNIGSQLIVSEGQKAIFFRNGQGLDVFGPGRHTLETQKLPLLEEVLKFPTDAEYTFNSKVYFVRVNRLNVKWGLPAIQLRNPGMDFYVDVGVSGSMDVQVIEDNESVRKFVYMIIGSSAGTTNNTSIGTNESYTTQYIADKFRDIVTTRFTDLMANIILENNINILDIESKKIIISEILRKDYNSILEEYGLVVPANHFNITTIKIHNSPEVERWKQQESERSTKTREEKLKEDILRSSQGRIRAEEENIAIHNILHAQGEGETAKVKAHTVADIEKIAAQGRSEATLIDVETQAKSVRISTLGEADAMRIKAQAEGESESLRAPGQAEAMVTMARAEGESSKQRAIGDSEAIRLTGQASAEAYSAQAMAEAEEMHAKGYTYAQETSRQIGLEAMQNGLPGTGNGGNGGVGGSIGSSMGNIMSLGIELGAMGSVIDMTKNILSPVMSDSVAAGQEITQSVTNTANSDTWNCSCGKTGISSKFCPECGTPRPIPQISGSWNCTCGCANITSKFCPDCGSPRPVMPQTWSCPSCGYKGITSKFCPECGHKKGE